MFEFIFPFKDMECKLNNEICMNEKSLMCINKSIYSVFFKHYACSTGWLVAVFINFFLFIFMNKSVFLVISAL